MTTSTLTISPEQWTQIATGASYVETQGVCGAYLVAVGPSAPTSTSSGILVSDSTGRYINASVAVGDNVYTIPTGDSAINIQVIAEAGGALVQPAVLAPFVATSGTAYDITKYGSVQVQVETLATNESVAVTGSLAIGGTKYPIANLLNQNVLNLSAVSSITVAGTYTILFGGNKELVFTRSGGSPNTAVITASAGQ